MDLSNNFKITILCSCSKKYINSRYFFKHCKTKKHKNYLNEEYEKFKRIKNNI